jgi:adenine-specific DNA-methyltransferase
MTVKLICGDCLPIMADMPDNSIDLIAVDPPYFKVKNECEWDRQWDTAAGFLAWIGNLCQQWQRILKPNGSLYVFASPKMAARVEVTIAERFNVLNHIVWWKSNGNRNWSADKTIWRSYGPNTERIIFAEHYGADNIAKGEAGYAAKCDELKGFVFESIRAYLDSERRRAGVPHRVVISELGMTGHDTHFFSRVQWKLPLPEQYEQMREIFHRLNHGGQYLQKPYEYLRREYEDLRREYEDLRREYEDLRREYEDLRRPFSVSADVPYTDVWTFPTVSAYAGKHPCEKPLAMMEHIVSVSSKPDAVVLDCCCGSGTTGVAAVKLGRSFIGIDKGQHWIDRTGQRIAEIEIQPALPLDSAAWDRLSDEAMLNFEQGVETCNEYNAI